MALGIWSWIGIAAVGWLLFSFAFAMVVGRAIRNADHAAVRRPHTPHRPTYRSGMREGEAAHAKSEDETRADGTHG